MLLVQSYGILHSKHVVFFIFRGGKKETLDGEASCRPGFGDTEGIRRSCTVLEGNSAAQVHPCDGDY